jgi:hypothetical protein
MIARPTPLPLKAETQPPLRAGANVRMGRNSLGVWMSGRSSGGIFSHPFTVNVAGNNARVSKGIVLGDISVEPLIGKVPVSGDAKHAQPVLRLDASLVDEIGQSWVCVEVTPDADGKLDPDGKKSKVVAVQRAWPMVMEGETGRAPLALLVLKGNRWEVHQVAMFNLRYITSKAEGGKRRHFFL